MTVIGDDTRANAPPPASPVVQGDIDMHIAADGTWFYTNSPIRRQSLVRLFASILRREDDGRFYLVTPYERRGVTVEDAPFLAVHLEVAGSGRHQILRFRTNVDDMVTVDEAHPLRFVREEGTDGLKPYVLVRDRIEALVSRSLIMDLADLAVVREIDGEPWLGLWSDGTFHPMAPTDGLDLGGRSEA